MTHHDLIDAVAELLHEPSDELRDAGITNELNLQGWLGARNLRLVPADPREPEISPGFWIAEHHDGRCVVMFDESPHAASAPVDVSPNELRRVMTISFQKSSRAGGLAGSNPGVWAGASLHANEKHLSRDPASDPGFPGEAMGTYLRWARRRRF